MLVWSPTLSFSHHVTQRKQQKLALMKIIESQRRVLEAYDCACEQQHLPASRARTHSESREIETVMALDEKSQSEWYANQISNLDQAKDQLTALRIAGDEFRVWNYKTLEESVLEISPLGEIKLYKISKQHYMSTDPMTFLRRYAVEDSQAVSDQRVEESRVCKNQWLIHELLRVRKDADDKSAKFCIGDTNITIVCLEWKKWHVKMTRLLADDSDEILEVIGCHLKRYNQSRIFIAKQLCELFELKQQTFSKTNPAHHKLLCRLWKAVFPAEPSPPVVANQWTRLGFQGNDPSTDFRSTGLLSLHMLVAFAETHEDDIRELVQMHPEREYPIAASAINLTAALVQLLELNKSKIHLPASDSRWDSPLFILLCHLQSSLSVTSPTIASVSHKISVSPQPLVELFGLSLRLIDYTFLRMRASYMQYPDVIAIVKSSIASAVTPHNQYPTAPLTLTQVRERALELIDKKIPKTSSWFRRPQDRWTYREGVIHDAEEEVLETPPNELAQSVRDEAENSVEVWQAAHEEAKEKEKLNTDIRNRKSLLVKAKLVVPTRTSRSSTIGTAEGVLTSEPDEDIVSDNR
eukprot:c9486_g1_i7.p1 GENE.c9486_g1_i7~~c9486_g1_i7.p1  ORF type:complete len:580 (+),score=133.59 c9486_g1_i7:741-2480(+)